MTVKELKKILNNIPDTAEVLLMCEQGQTTMNVYDTVISRSTDTSYPDGMIFEFSDWESCYDENAIKEYNKNGKITAILIEG